jgi:hypothetical protein
MSDICETCGYDWVERDAWERHAAADKEEAVRMAFEAGVKATAYHEGILFESIPDSWMDESFWKFQAERAKASEEAKREGG